MKSFTYFQPTDIRFGRGTLDEVGEVTARFGKRCLIVTVPILQAFGPVFERVKSSLQKAGVEWAHFDGVIPNPTTDCVDAGREPGQRIWRGRCPGRRRRVEHGYRQGDRRRSHPSRHGLGLPVLQDAADSQDSANHRRFNHIGHWLAGDPGGGDDRDEDQNKIGHLQLDSLSQVAIVDPDLMLTVPSHITASTGFDVFCHAFESYLHPAASPYTDMLGLEAIRLVASYLPRVVADGTDIEGREAMAWADTLAGLCIANAGVTLPHGIGMTISGHCPQIMHGESLAVTYPEFTRFTYPYAVHQFAEMGRIFDLKLKNLPDEEAAAGSCQVLDAFQKKIGMWLSLKSLARRLRMWQPSLITAGCCRIIRITRASPAGMKFTISWKKAITGSSRPSRLKSLRSFGNFPLSPGLF